MQLEVMVRQRNSRTPHFGGLALQPQQQQQRMSSHAPFSFVCVFLFPCLQLDLNMALCRLKQCEWKCAIDQCRMALQLDPSSVKAFYRIAQAHVGMADWQEAKQALAKASKLDAAAKEGQANKCAREIASLQTEIRKKEAEEREKTQKYARQLEAKLAKNKTAFAQTNGDNATDSSTEEGESKQAALSSAASTPAADTAPQAHDADDVSDLASCLRDAALNPRPVEQV